MRILSLTSAYVPGWMRAHLACGACANADRPTRLRVIGDMWLVDHRSPVLTRSIPGGYTSPSCVSSPIHRTDMPFVSPDEIMYTVDPCVSKVRVVCGTPIRATARGPFHRDVRRSCLHRPARPAMGVKRPGRLKHMAPWQCPGSEEHVAGGRHVSRGRLTHSRRTRPGVRRRETR